MLRRLTTFGCLLACLLHAGRAENERWYQAIDERAFQANYDPTLIGRRLLWELSYEDDTDSDTTKLQNEARYSALVAPNLAAGAQIAWPLMAESGAGAAVGGAGDLSARAGVVGRVAEGLRAGTGLNVKFPTATAPALSEPWQLRPIAAVSWDVRKGLNAGVQAEWNISPADTGPSRVNNVKFTLPVGLELSARWSVTASYKAEIEANGGAALSKIEAGPTLLLGRDRQFAISPAIEAPLSQQSLQWKALLTAGWYY